MPTIAIVGLADKAIAESRERVRAALSSIRLALPSKRIAVNLASADEVKEGTHFDLPIALGLLIAMGVVSPDLVSLLNHLKGTQIVSPPEPKYLSVDRNYPDMSDLKG